MKTNFEKQVAAFEKLLGHCNAHGAMYNPSKESMKVAALNTLLTSAQQTLQAVDIAQNGLILAINARQQAFNPLPKIGTRIVNALAGTDASPELVKDVKMIRDRFRFKVPAIKPESGSPEDSSNATPTPAVRKDSLEDSSRGPISHLDFESKIRNLGMLIQLLASEPSYKPNEADLQVAGLETKLSSLRKTHKAVMNAEIILSNARLARNKMIADANGIHGTGLRIKRYIRSVFGATSDQYRQIAGLKFRK